MCSQAPPAVGAASHLDANGPLDVVESFIEVAPAVTQHRCALIMADKREEPVVGAWIDV